MTTYYVRASMGNDGNTGLSPAQAWLTIDKAANEVAAADTVYIGSGVYRELVTMDTSGTSGNEISFIGDIDGVQTGDPGPVIITAHDSEYAGAARAACLDMVDKEFIIWQYVIFVDGTTAAVWSATVSNLAFEGCELLDCVFYAGPACTYDAVQIDVNTGATPAGNGLQIERCFFSGQCRIYHDNNAAAHVNLKWNIKNCVFTSNAGCSTAKHAILLSGSTSDTYSIGGIDIVNCTFTSFSYGVHGYRYLKDTTNQVRVLNCILCNGGRGIGETTCTNNAMYEDYNFVHNIISLISGDVQQGGNSAEGKSAPLMGGMADLMFYNKLGWSPWKPWELMAFQDGSYETPGVGFGSAAYAPADDIYGNPRPMRRGDDVGAIEARARGQDETGTVRTDSHSMAIKGAGYHDMHLPVDAALTTVSVYARYDGNYTGSLPKLEILEIPGVADQSDIQTGASGSWEALSCAFTPTSAGYVRVRLLSQDTSADGECFFDDLAVS